tara:strand:- start:1179 stop:3494 length:2316 start_codon:yes stop_codon:yes gene_type:complete
MALVSASIPNLINGVSQQPPSLRLKTQAELQENGFSTVVDGLKKRPSSEHIKTLSNVPTNIDSGFIHTIRRDENEFYILVITNNVLKVYDKNGLEQTVTESPTGAISYLSGLTDPSKELTATTIADFTFIVNKNKVVAKDTTNKSPQRPEEALFYVRQGDYKTDFTIRVKYQGTTYSASKTTLDSSNAANQGDVRTNTIMSDLATTLTGVLPAGFTTELLDNVFYVKRDDNAAFEVEASDSRGDTFIYAFKGQTANFDDLPPRGKEGFLIEVIGDNEKGQDDYYVQLSDPDGNGQLVWKERVAPNLEINFDKTTMPHQLIRQADGTFLFTQASWKDRKAGDDDTNPFPSFTGFKVNDLFFHRNRLGMLSDENVILSEVGEYFNFFQNTVITFVDSAPIDVAVSNNQVSILRHAVPFSEQLLLFSDLTQFVLRAEQFLAPDTVSIDVTTQFEASLRAKPVGAGKYVFFPTNRGKFSGVREYFVDNSSNTNTVNDAADITAHIPSYIQGEVISLKASSNEDALLLLTDDSADTLYVYKYYWSATDKLQSAWSKWKFNGSLLNVDFNLSEIFILIKRGTDVCLEKINLSKDEAVDVTDANHPILLDRRVKLTNGGTTTVPYTDSNTIFVRQDGQQITQSQVATALAANKVVYAGIPFTFKYEFSEQVIKRDNAPITIGRLSIKNWNIVYNDSGFFECKVTPDKRTAKTRRFTGRNIGSLNNVIGKVSIDSGTFSFPVLSRADSVKVEIESNSFLPCIFQSAEWEGFYTLRSRRL